MRYLVLFEREHHDSEIIGPAEVTPRASFEQLLLEFDARITIAPLGYIESHPRIVFLTQIDFQGDWAALREHLQDLYDDLAIEGNFNIVGRAADGTAILPGVDPLA